MSLNEVHVGDVFVWKNRVVNRIGSFFVIVGISGRHMYYACNNGDLVNYLHLPTWRYVEDWIRLGYQPLEIDSDDT